ncbi:hypothetical protein [Antarcticirhabdus aurantiaca]|uniref:Uncharacterized protein n=1 Tax=Antarcticirhabdus aurantiaca TaxID=2606717 RepID=A0ACD4NRJ4_9HYPH|nr:hypothetical protein OXU80_03580 [Jeongeuplla avenae]
MAVAPKRILKVGKSRISIGAMTTDVALAGMKADTTYVPIGGIRNIGNSGMSYQAINVEEIDDGIVRKGKGVGNPGSLPLTMSRRPTDAGQLKLIEASRSDDAFNIRIEEPAGGGKWQVTYATALVMGRENGRGGPNDTRTLISTLEFTEEAIEDPTLADTLAA